MLHIIRKYAQKSAQAGNSHAKRCMVCAQMLTMLILITEHEVITLAHEIIKLSIENKQNCIGLDICSFH